MFLSKFYLPILKETPSEASVVSHQLMLKSGMIRQLTSGIYNWLPLGLKILNKISSVIRNQLDTDGQLEILMPCVQPAELWIESGRYNDYGKEMLRIKDRHDNDLLFGPTAEEVVTDIMRKSIHSYKNLPKIFYQISWKFRDEIRPRFGVMRGREFLMKDAYSFAISKEQAEQIYFDVYKTYLKIFRKLGLTPIPVMAPTGPIGGNLSHEFHVLANTGESQIYYDKSLDNLLSDIENNFDSIKKCYAVEKEMFNENDMANKNIITNRGIEVGHIFYFDQKYSQALNAKFTNKEGREEHYYMGSYGIGVSRVLAAIIEANHDDKGMVWPKEIYPFAASLINLQIQNQDCNKISLELYDILTKAGFDVLYDDTDASIGSKFATHDLIGSPLQIIIGPKSIASGMIEIKERKSGQIHKLTKDEILNYIKSFFSEN